MEAIWNQMPVQLTEKICNLLPSLHPLPPPLKGDIESGAGWLKLFANRFSYYQHMDTWYIVAHVMIERLPKPMTTNHDILAQMTMQEYCEAIWANISWEERGLILTGDYTEMMEELDEREAHWEAWNEARLNREDEYPQ